MIPELQTPEPAREQTFWSYEDLALFAGAWIPAILAASLLVRPIHFSNQGVTQTAFQMLIYALLLSILYLLVGHRYHQPFWRSLGWRFNFPGAWICLLTGPPMAIGLAILATALHAPSNSPIPGLITDRSSMIAVLLFGALAGPIFEETVFRGFLQPLLAKSMAAWLAIILTAIPFALLHGPGFAWAWQSMAIVGLAGVIMGFARHLTGSTAASALIHVGYNSTLFAGFLLQRSV